jgi:hypothetical protein
MNTDKILTLARKHVAANVTLETLAREELARAVWLLDEGQLEFARGHALKSLAHSIGRDHRDYKRAAR